MSTFWADELARRAEERHSAPYVVSDTKTPSGTIHIGALRGVILHDALARVLRRRGHAVTYLYGFDDFDPFDKVPTYLDPSYHEYLGQPMSVIPPPDEQGRPQSGPITNTHNYGRHFADDFEAVYRTLGVESTTVYSSDLYARGEFDEAIRLILDRADTVKVAYEEAIAHRSDDRAGQAVVADFPLNVRCQQCGRSATTEVTAWDGERVTYRCRRGVVPYVDGCGWEASVAPFGGAAKLPWKVEWAAKWYLWQSDIEGGGKDHYTKGGSHDVATAVFNHVFAPQAKPGYDRVPVDLFYEWFYIDGRKMSTSKGVGQSASQVAAQIPPELLRLLMVRTRPKTAVNYRETADSLPDLYDAYDQVLEAARTDPQSLEGKLFSLIRLNPDQPLPPAETRFRTLVAQQEQARLLGKARDRDDLSSRSAVARQWVDRFGSQPTVVTMTPAQRAFLTHFADRLSNLQSWEPVTLQTEIFSASQSVSLKAQDAFEAIYGALLGSTHGPQAGSLLASRDRATVLEKLRTVAKESQSA
ncbi:lysine--tRNA ligase [Candidatus Berkelbacteria bacterium]|nr:lysine--tRNA ligase [Candidatus Berkelbacteria bacterium]